jgi:phosphoenolpyruvate phosphomutase
MKAIIIAAGMGQRLRPYTADRPKCMVEIKGRSLLERQVEAYRAVGIEEIIVIRGYRGRQIQLPGLTYIDNPHFRQNNILESLFCAREHLFGDVMISYGDITFHPDLVKELMPVQAPISLVIDLDWESVYEGRDDHPVEQAELCEVIGIPTDAMLKTDMIYRITEVGKQVPPDRAHGEFIGLCKIHAPALARLCALYDHVSLKGLDEPYINAPSLRKAYLCDLFNDAIRRDEFIQPFFFKGGMWREIDTVQDYERAQESVTW